MFLLFISHAGENSGEAVAIFEWLKREGWDDVFLDRDRKQGIMPGERWEIAITQAGSRCEAVLFLISRSWLDSESCREEFDHARHLNKTLFALIIDRETGIDELPKRLKGTWQAVDLTSGHDHTEFLVKLPITHEEERVTFSKEGLMRLRNGLAKAGLDPRFFLWPPADEPNRPPYCGLKPFEAEDAGIFFGRDATIADALDRLRRLREAPSPRLLVILGASGAGKSSFLRAGILPRLQRDDQRFLPLPPVRPERSAINGNAGFVRALEIAFNERGIALADIRAAVEGGAPTLIPLLMQLMPARSSGGSDGDSEEKSPVLVLPIDQAEELFPAEGNREAESLVALLKELLVVREPGFIVLATIRTDSFERLQTAKALEGIFPNTLSLPPMPTGSYQTVIEGPVARLAETGRALAIEPALTYALLADIEAGGSRDALPLLAFTLERIYLEYHARGRLTLRDYEQLGGIKGSIEAAIERAFDAANADPRIPRERQARLALLRRGFIPWLAGIDPDTGRPRRRVARMSEIPTEARPLIDQLKEQRLLATDVTQTGEVTIEPVHEALLRQWGALENWLKEDFGALMTIEGVKRAARDWDANAKNSAWLAHSGARLEEAERLEKRNDLSNHLTPLEWEYLALCRQKAITETRRRRRLKMILTGLSLVIITTATVVLFLWRQEQNTRAFATAERLTSEAGELGSFSPPLLERSILLAIEALHRYPLPGARQILHDNLDLTLRPVAKLNSLNPFAAIGPVHTSPASCYECRREAASLAFSSDGHLAATIDDTKTVRIFAAPDWHEVANYDHDGPVVAMEFSNSHRYLATASKDKTVCVFDIDNRKKRICLPQSGSANAVSFSPDSKYLATGSKDGSVRVFDAEDWREVANFAGTGAIAALSYNATGDRLAAATTKTLLLFDIPNRQQIAALDDGNNLLEVAFSNDRRYIATSADDRASARVFDFQLGQQLAKYSHDGSRDLSIALSEDGSLLALGGLDGSVRLYSTTPGSDASPVAAFRLPERILAIAFRGQSDIAMTLGDETTRIFNLRSGQQWALLTYSWLMASSAFSPDGELLAVKDDHGTVRLYAIPASYVLTSSNPFRIVAFSHDNKYIAAAVRDVVGDAAQVFDVKSGEMVVRARPRVDGESLLNFLQEPPRFNAVTFSLDNKYLATIDFLGPAARIFETKTGRETQHFGIMHGLSVAFGPDGRSIVVGNFAEKDATQIFDVASGQERLHFPGRVVTAVSLDPTGRFLAVGYGSMVGPISHIGGPWMRDVEPQDVKVFDVNNGNEVSHLTHDGGLSALSFSPDGRYVLTGSLDRTARLFETLSGREIHRFDQAAGVTSVAFSANGKLAAVASGPARIFDVVSGDEFIHFNGSIVAMGFSPDSNRFMTASLTGGDHVMTIKEHLLNIEDLISEGCYRVVRNLTRREWKQYFPEESYHATCPNFPPEDH